MICVSSVSADKPFLSIATVFLPYAAPSTGAFGGNSPKGAEWIPPVVRGTGSPFGQPPPKARSAGSKRRPGRIFFGDFLLARQKKVTRRQGGMQRLSHRDYKTICVPSSTTRFDGILKNAVADVGLDDRQEVVVAFNFETLRLLTDNIDLKSTGGVD